MSELGKLEWVSLFALGTALTACGSDTPPGAGTPADGAPVRAEERVDASARLASLFERYRAVGKAAATTSARSLAGTLPSARSGRFRSQPDAERLRFEAETSAPLEVAVGARADGAFSVRDRASDVAVSVVLVGARPAPAHTAGSRVLYAEATSEGASLVRAVTAIGVEDFVELFAPPPNDAVEYTLELDGGTQGLRLAGNSLELVDGLGVPRLHLAPPYVVGSNGAVTSATLAVEGCAVDRASGAPWGLPPLSPGARRCRLLVRFDASAVRYPALLDPAWNQTQSLATARTGAQAVVLGNGRVLVAGGRGFDGTALDSAELYNPATRTWASTGSLAGARADFTLTLRPNGQALAAGGRDANGGTLSTTELYDASSGAWSAGAALALPHADHRAVVLGTGDVLVAGGTTTAAEKLSNRTSTWSSAGTVLVAVSGHTLTQLADGRALLIGGNQAETYDPATTHWLPVSAPPAASRERHSATRLANGQVLVFDDQTPTTELFDATSGVWSRPGAAITRRSGHTATPLADGRVLVAGGAPEGTPTYLASEIFSPSSGTSAPGPAMLTPRRDHVAALLSSGKVLLAGGSDPSGEQVLNDAEEFDPASLAVTTAEYKLPAKVDPEVLSDRVTELWASVTRPAAAAAGKRYPLLVFLHGNHGTCGTGTNPRHDFSCQYTDTGTCPSGYVVTPNHRGYDYIANELAARGFVVVSINANRGINCAGGAGDDFGLNLARGRLILRHLEQLSAWNRGVSATPASLGATLQGSLDFGQVGLLGHSRGGEGVRAAYEQYRDSGSPWPARLVDPLAVRAVFEIGPVDGQSSRVLNASGATWNVLLPMCDGDVSDLEGVRPFDRMIQNTTSANAGAKSTYTVWGANHNFFNTEWQDSDSGGCTDHRALFSPAGSGSAEQRQTALEAVVSFFVANLGGGSSPELADLFNPEHRVVFDSPVQRGYAPDAAQTKVLEEFKNAASTSGAGIRNLLSRVSVTQGPLPEHDDTLRGATVTWSAPGSSTYFQVNLTNTGSGVDLRAYDLLDFRVDRPKDPANFAATTSFEVALVNADDTLSALVSPAAYADVVAGPAGGPYQNYHEMLETVRLPLGAFAAANLASIRGVRFVFRQTPSGSIYLANLRATRSTLLEPPNPGATPAPPAFSSAPGGGARALAVGSLVTSGNGIVSLRTSADGKSVELRLATGTPFLPRAALLELTVSSATSTLSQHPGGDLKQVVFTLDKASFDALPNGADVRVSYAGAAGTAWDFGPLDKRALDR